MPPFLGADMQVGHSLVLLVVTPRPGEGLAENEANTEENTAESRFLIPFEHLDPAIPEVTSP